MRRNPIAAVWIGGALLAGLVYAAGPDGLVQGVVAALAQARAVLADALSLLTVQAFDALRAAAIGLLAVFLVLGAMAARRGLRARAALVLVPGLFLLLTGTGDAASGPRWAAGFVLAAVGAVAMSRRLAQPPGRSFQPFDQPSGQHPGPWGR